MNIFQSLLSAARKPERPLHVGEVMTLWTILTQLQDGYGAVMSLSHHTADPDLKHYMQQHMRDFDLPWIKRVKQFMLDRSIPLPAPTTEKPLADEGQIPTGARFTEIEIAEMLVVMFRSGLQMLHHGMIECLNYELGTLLMEMHLDALRDSLMLRELMENRGWLKSPPQWNPPGASK